jgi:hypothetical protein
MLLPLSGNKGPILLKMKKTDMEKKERGNPSTICPLGSRGEHQQMEVQKAVQASCYQ